MSVKAEREAEAPRYFKAVCPICGYSVRRAKRDSAEHVMSQHVVYFHDHA